MIPSQSCKQDDKRDPICFFEKTQVLWKRKVGTRKVRPLYQPWGCRKPGVALNHIACHPVLLFNSTPGWVSSLYLVARWPSDQLMGSSLS